MSPMKHQQLLDLIGKLDLPAERVQSLREDMGGGTADWNRMGLMWGLLAALPKLLVGAYGVIPPPDLADLVHGLLTTILNFFDRFGKQG